MPPYPPVITKRKQPLCVQRLQEGYNCLLLGQLGQKLPEGQCLQGTPLKALMVLVEVPNSGASGRNKRPPDPLHLRQACLCPLDSYPIKLHLRGRERSLHMPPRYSGDGRGPPYLLHPPSVLGLSREIIDSGQGHSAEWRRVSVALTFPTRVRSLVKVPSYKESSSERRIPGP